MALQIEASDWAPESREFRAEELERFYFSELPTASIADGLAYGMEEQLRRLSAAGVRLLDVEAKHAIRDLKLLDAATFWIALSPAPADQWLAFLLNFDDTGRDLPRPQWARSVTRRGSNQEMKQPAP